MKEGLPFAQDSSLENSVDSCLCFRLALLHSVSSFFFFYQSSLSLCMVFDAISSNIDDFLSINPSANVFVFGDSNHKDCITYSDGTYRLVNFVIIFLSQMILLRWLTSLLGSQTVTLTVPLFWIFISFDASICFTMASPSLGNSDHVVVSVSINFLLNSKRDAPFHCVAYDYSHVD